MGLELWGMRRKIHSSDEPLPKNYVPWMKCVQAYESGVISDVWKDLYSKTNAVRILYESVKAHPDGPEQKILLRALLTDRGLLFP